MNCHICGEDTGNDCMCGFEDDRPIYNQAMGVIDELKTALAEKDVEEKQIRLFLLLNHGHEAPYLDDGEMQCGECLPSWDYKRLPLQKLIERVSGIKDEEITQLKERVDARNDDFIFMVGECKKRAATIAKQNKEIARLKKLCVELVGSDMKKEID